MSRQKAPVISLRDPNGKTQSYAATTARLFGVGGNKPQLPPRNPPRNIENARATSSRTSCGSVSRAEAEGLAHAKIKDREIPRSGVTKERDSSARANDYKHTLRQNDTQRLVYISASDFEPLATGKPLSLKEFSKGMSFRGLPCLVKVVTGYRSLCEYYSFSKEQMFMVLEKKSMLVVTCKGLLDGSSYAVPLNTTAFHLVPYWMDAAQMRPSSFGKITANELLQSKALPPVLAVSVEFEVGEHHSKKTVPVGTLLFPKEKKQSNNQRQLVLHAKSKCGEMVLITPDCKGRFSILASDVKLSLQQAITHLNPPFTMRTVSDCDTLYVRAITVENVHQEDVFIGMMKTRNDNDDIASYSRMIEIPVSFNLTVVTMVPKQQKVLAEYSGSMQRPVRSPSKPPDGVIMAPNPAYIALMPTNHEKKANFTNHEKTKFSGHPASSARARVASPPYREEHIHDAVNNYKALPTAANLRMPSLDAKVAGTPLGSSQTSSDAAAAVEYYKEMPTVADQVVSPDSKVEETPLEGASSSSDDTDIDYYEDLPAVATQQAMPPDSEANGTVFDSEKSPSEKNVPTSMTQGGCVVEAVANIAYLKKMQREDILHLLDAMNLSVYKEAFKQEQIDGETMACLSTDMLIELGVSKSLHRLRLMKIISGGTSASSFITIP